MLFAQGCPKALHRPFGPMPSATYRCRGPGPSKPRAVRAAGTARIVVSTALALGPVDVEGGEPGVLAGLTQPLRSLSFEYLPRALDYVAAAVARLCALGAYRFNWSPGESYRLVSDRWLRDDELAAALATTDAQRRSGDVYARLDLPASN